MTNGSQPVDTHDVYEALADIVAEALPVDLEPNSKNIKLLRRIAESSHFGFNEDLPNTVDEERPCVRVPIAVDDEARLHVLLGHGHHAAFREELYRHYQTIVFSLKTYAVTRREFSFWPFAADNASVQWPVVEALIVTLMSTVKQWTNDPDSPPDVWDLYNGMQVGPQNMQIGTQIGWDARPPHDWAGIEGTWTGVRLGERLRLPPVADVRPACRAIGSSTMATFSCSTPTLLMFPIWASHAAATSICD